MSHFSAPLLAYQKALVENDRLNAAIKLQHSTQKGRYLSIDQSASQSIKAGDVLLTETAVLSSDDLKNRCLGCHQSPILKNHQTSCAVYQTRYQPINKSIKLILDLCDQLSYPVNRAYQAIEYVVRINSLLTSNPSVNQSVVENGLFPADPQPKSSIKQSTPSVKPASLAAQFAEPASTPSFSFAIDAPVVQSTQSIKPEPSIDQSVASLSINEKPADQSNNQANNQLTDLPIVDLALLTVSHLDAGDKKMREMHNEFASGFWRLLPQSIKRNLTISQTAKLFTIFHLNSHELFFDDLSNNQTITQTNNQSNGHQSGSFGEGLFPFFAMIEHSCAETCAFTQYIAPPNQANNQTNNQTAGLSINQIMAEAKAKKLREADLRHPVVQLRALYDMSSKDQSINQTNNQLIDLSINYCPPYLPTRSRRAYLSDHYGFKCQCRLCSGGLPDKCRSIWCPQCEKDSIIQSYDQSDDEPNDQKSHKKGIMCPFGEGEGANEWKCDQSNNKHALDSELLQELELVEDGLNDLLTALGLGEDDIDQSIQSHDQSNNQSITPKNKEHAYAIALSQTIAICQMVVDHNRHLIDQSDLSTSQTIKQSDNQTNGESNDDSSEQSNTQSDEQSNNQSDKTTSQSKTQQKNARRRAKARAELNQSRLSMLPFDVRLIDRLHPSHYLIHALMETFTKICIGKQNEQSKDQSNNHSLFDENFSLLVSVCSLCRSNVSCVAGPTHWLNAVAASQTAELYSSQSTNQSNNQQAISQARHWHQICLEINMKVFGEHSSATRTVQDRLNQTLKQVK